MCLAKPFFFFLLIGSIVASRNCSNDEVEPFDAGPRFDTPQDACFCAGCPNVQLFLAFIADMSRCFHLILCGTANLCLCAAYIDLCSSRQGDITIVALPFAFTLFSPLENDRQHPYCASPVRETKKTRRHEAGSPCKLIFFP